MLHKLWNADSHTWTPPWLLRKEFIFPKWLLSPHMFCVCTCKELWLSHPWIINISQGVTRDRLHNWVQSWLWWVLLGTLVIHLVINPVLHETANDLQGITITLDLLLNSTAICHVVTWFGWESSFILLISLTLTDNVAVLFHTFIMLLVFVTAPSSWNRWSSHLVNLPSCCDSKHNKMPA